MMALNLELRGSKLHVHRQLLFLFSRTSRVQSSNRDHLVCFGACLFPCVTTREKGSACAFGRRPRSERHTSNVSLSTPYLLRVCRALSQDCSTTTAVLFQSRSEGNRNAQQDVPPEQVK